MSSFTVGLCGNQGDPANGVQGRTHPRTSVKSEEEGSACWKSEAPIRAMKPGNAGGAKGSQSEITVEGNMCRHRAEKKKRKEKKIQT